MAPSWSPVLPVLFLAFAGVRACPPGSGGPNCDWNMKMLYFEHDVYKDIREKPPRPLDLTVRSDVCNSSRSAPVTHASSHGRARRGLLAGLVAK